MSIFRDKYVANAEAVPYHKKWMQQNPGEATKWRQFRDAVLIYEKGDEIAIPSMATRYGRALVAAGELHMSVTDLGAVWDPPEPPPPTGDSLPLQPPSWTGPIVISSGGTYSGISPESTSNSTPAIFITTTQPVIIEDSWIRHLGTSRLISTSVPLAVNLTIRGCRAYGGNGFFIELEGHKSFVMENCTVDKTACIRLNVDGTGSTTRIRYNQFRNIQEGPGYLSAAVKFNWVRNGQGTTEIAWNEIVNEYNLSHPEDIISLINSRYVQVHDNYIQHQSKPGNAYNTSSQNCITLEQGCSDCTVTDNQMVDTLAGIGFFAPSTNNLATGNRLIQDGFLPDGVTRMGNGYSGNSIGSGCVNCHMHNNVSGYVNRDGVRNDWWPFEAPEGPAAEIANNTTLPDPITRQMEVNEWTIWQNKLANNGITVGA